MGWHCQVSHLPCGGRVTMWCCTLKSASSRSLAQVFLLMKTTQASASENTDTVLLASCTPHGSSSQQGSLYGTAHKAACDATMVIWLTHYAIYEHSSVWLQAANMPTGPRLVACARCSDKTFLQQTKNKIQNITVSYPGWRWHVNLLWW